MVHPFLHSRCSDAVCVVFQVDIAVCIEGGESGVVTFIGVGFDKRLMGDSMNIADASHFTGVPSVQQYVPPTQVTLAI